MASQFIRRAVGAAVLVLGGAFHAGCVLPEYVEAKGSCEPGEPWTKKLGGDLFDILFASAPDPCGGVTVGGGFQSFIDFGLDAPIQATKGASDAYVARFDAVGDIQWVTPAGLDGNQFVTHLKTDIFGNAVAAGVFSGTLKPSGGEEVASEGAADGIEFSGFLTKLDLFGVHQWTRVYRSDTNQISTGPCGVVVDGEGSVTIAGNFLSKLEIEGNLHEGALLAGSIFVAHYDTKGAFLWSKSFATDKGVDCNAIAGDKDGNILMTGAYGGSIDFGRGALMASDIGTRFFVLKMSPDGNVEWSRGTNDGDDQIGTAITTDVAGNVFVGGTFFGKLNLGSGNIVAMEGTDIFLQKLSSAGAPQWGRSYAGKSNDEVLAIQVDSAGDLVIGGATLGEVTFEQTHSAPVMVDPMKPARDALLVRLRGSDGEPIASRTFKGPDDDVLNALALDQSDYPIVAGTFFSKVDLGPGPGEIVADDIGLGSFYVAKMAPLSPP